MLGRACASTAMIYAMHQTKVACLARHGSGSAWHRAAAAPAVHRAAAACLLDHRRSGRRRRAQQRGAGRAAGCAHRARAAGDRHLLRRGGRRHRHHGARARPTRRAADQVLVVFLKQDYTLERLSGWDALGMRGTCSARLQARVAAGASEQILPVSLRQDSRADHDAGRASGLERRLGRHRRRGRRARPRFRAQGRAARRAARCRPAPRTSRAPAPRCARCAASSPVRWQRFESAAADAAALEVGRLPDRHRTCSRSTPRSSRSRP